MNGGMDGCAFTRHGMTWGRMDLGCTDGNYSNHSDATATAAAVFVL